MRVSHSVVESVVYEIESQTDCGFSSAGDVLRHLTKLAFSMQRGLPSTRRRIDGGSALLRQLRRLLAAGAGIKALINLSWLKI